MSLTEISVLPPQGHLSVGDRRSLWGRPCQHDGALTAQVLESVHRSIGFGPRTFRLGRAALSCPAAVRLAVG